MGVGRRIMLGFAMCAAYGPGSRERETASATTGGRVPAQGDRVPAGGGPCGEPAPQRVGRTVAAIVIAGTALTTVMALVMIADGHRSFRITFRHLGVLFSDRAVQRLVRDPFLAGAGLCVLAVLGFVLVTVALISPASPVRPAVQRVLTEGHTWVADRRPRRGRTRRPGNVTRRPPTSEATRPDTRPVTRKRVLGRAKG